MRFYEYEARRLLEKRGLPVPRGGLAKTASDAERIAKEVGAPVVVKAQILFGDRGKARAVAATPADAKREAERLLDIVSAGKKPAGVLVEQVIEPEKAIQLRVTFDGTAKRPVMIGTDVLDKALDDVADDTPERVKRRHFSALLAPSPYRAKEFVKDLGQSGNALNRLTGFAAALGQMLLDHDLTIFEISRLGIAADGQLVALEYFADLEIEARPRQKAMLDELGVDPADLRLPRDPTAFDKAGAKIDKDDPRGVAGPIVEFDGNIGLVIGAGGGSLTTFDAVRKHGGNPANYAALGGNPSVAKARALTELVLNKAGVEKLLVISNVVSNTRADLVARGVIKGCLALGKDPAKTITVFRVPGAWEADAAKILAKYGIEYCDRTVSISEAARRGVEKVGKG